MSRVPPVLACRGLVVLLAVSCVLVGNPATGANGQNAPALPAVTTSFESRFEAPLPVPAGHVDQVFELVDLAPGAATPIHYHLGPGFATILQGEVTHHRLMLGRDVVYGLGDTWVEIPEDVHFARNEGTEPSSILATFILPSAVDVTYATQPLAEGTPAPTVPAFARAPITRSSAGYEVVQLVRSYPPGASATSTVTAGSQAVVLVTQGQLTVRSGKDARSFYPGERWLERADAPTTVLNSGATTATTMMSTVGALP